MSLSVSSQFLTYLAPAKLNLGLKIVGKKDDGYHLLHSIFCLINLFDEISIQITPNPTISLIEHNQAWPYQQDLAFKAAQLLQQVTNCPYGAKIKVKKTIPYGSGLGGGSSNAATVLIALNRLWQLNLSVNQLISLASTLGADVPFFIFGQNAVVKGIGEILSPLHLPKQYFVLVKPCFPISTREIFNHLQWQKSNLNDLSDAELLTSKENDLQPVAINLYPQLGAVFDDLKQFGKPVMTGSGSTIYLTFALKSQAKKVASQLQKRYNTYLVKSLTLSPVYTSNF